MASTVPGNDAAIREKAYLLWEQEGRPDGRDMEFWTRATVAVAEKTQLDTLTAAPPKRKAAAAKSARTGGGDKPKKA